MALIRLHGLGNLVVATLMHIRDHTSLPQPCCAVLMSPWLDLSGAQTRNNPLGQSDFILNYDISQPIMNEAVRPVGLPFDTPEISPLLAKDVSRLPPQLVFYGETELLSSDSKRWITRCREVGVRVSPYSMQDAMHTFSIGWPISGVESQEKCDKMFMKYIFEELGLSK